MEKQYPLISIGLPVFNGERHIGIALDSLLSQDYPHVEILISDNASTDGTQAICERYSQRYTTVQYVRNSENIGPFKNYLATLARAQGQFFFWASHDDKWAPQFASSLVKTLLENPDSPLATPAILHVNADGSLRNDPPDRPAPGTSFAENLRVLYDDHAASWVYGIYRTEWLRGRVGDWGEYPLWGSDVMWLADLCLQYRLTGNSDALIFKRLRMSSFAPSTARAVVCFWAYMFYYFTKITWRRVTDWPERLRLTAWAWRYVYRLAIRRPGLIRTAWRVVRLLCIAAVSSLPQGLSWLGRQVWNAGRRETSQSAVSSRAEPPETDARQPGSTALDRRAA